MKYVQVEIRRVQKPSISKSFRGVEKASQQQEESHINKGHQREPGFPAAGCPLSSQQPSSSSSLDP